MLRYGKLEDKEWITRVYREAETPDYHTINVEGLIANLDTDLVNKKYLVDDEGFSFACFEVEDQWLHNFVILTDEAHRGHNYAKEIYAYQFAMYRKPIMYRVIKDSESEQIWAKRSPYIISITDKLAEEEIDGFTYCKYLCDPYKINK